MPCSRGHGQTDHRTSPYQNGRNTTPCRLSVSSYWIMPKSGTGIGKHIGIEADRTGRFLSALVSIQIIQAGRTKPTVP